MRLVLELHSENGLTVPIHYNYIIQGFIYNSISPKLADILHNKGFTVGKRKFKLFTFSRILGRYNLDNRKGRITFNSPFKLIISSAMGEFIEEIGEELLLSETVRIGSQNVSLNSVEVSGDTIDRDSIKIKMLSPMTMYSTLRDMEGNKKTYYYSPFESDFSDKISDNARKKYKAYYDKEPEGEIRIEPLKVNTSNQKIIMYKGTVIKGWMGIYQLSGDRELMNLVYDTGLGGKNSQGFGCFEIVGNS